jgi:hypothetical protein
MFRILALFACAFALLITPSNVRWLIDPISPTAFRIDARPVLLNESNPAQRRIGELDYLGGVALKGLSPAFGGLSGLVLRDNGFDAVGDMGTMLQVTTTKQGNLEGALTPLPSGCGIRSYKIEQDVESLVRDPVSGVSWVGLEGRQSLCILKPGQNAREIQPAVMKNWWSNSGPEAMTLLPGGGLLIFAEHAPKRTHEKPLLYFAKAPLDGETPHIALSYLPPRGFAPVDAAALRDGRILVLNRKYIFPTSFTSVLTIIDKPDYRSGVVLKGREIARFEPPIITDNFEGIAIKETPDGAFIWLLSDDNFFWFQQTLLLKFRLRN